ncbi:hypothetical protein Tco_1029063 [Tanacetum coccineum]|uniref:Uncharacterized protein n=1 Tax=Tanacetum coccineum TaxID=301880 RepID=A0ABQ5G448_9ASTR
MNEYKGIMPTKIELTLEQSQQGVSNDVLDSYKDGDGDTSFQLSQIHYLMLMLRLQRHTISIKIQGKLLTSFQEDAKYEHAGQDTRSQGGTDDQDKQGKDLEISKSKTKSKDNDKG